jgi:hypothetical protein
MGAHKTYGQFRGAKEIMEMLDLDPEENADAKTMNILRALVWRGPSTQRGAGSHGSSSVAAEPTAEVEMLRAEAKSLNADVERLTTQVKASIDAQAATLETLKQQNALFLANLDPGKRKEMKSRIETMSTDGAVCSPATASLVGEMNDSTCSGAEKSNSTATPAFVVTARQTTGDDNVASRQSFARRASNITRASVARQVSYFAQGEKAALRTVRGKPWLRKLLLALVPAAAVCAWLVPFLMTGETSRQGVGDACKENYVELWLSRHDEESLDIAVENYDENAHVRLDPAHTFNAVSTFFSSASFLLWVHFTPHRKSSASMLDQKRTSGHSPFA